MSTVHANAHSSSETTVLATVMIGLEEYIQHQGGNSEIILNRSGLTQNLVEKPNQPISLAKYCKAIDEAAKQTGNDNFGLWFGHQYSIEAFGLVGYLCLSSKTLREAIYHLTKYFPIHQQNSLVAFKEDQGICRLEYRITDGYILHRRHDAELTIALFLNIMRHALGQFWSPCEINFEHTRPESYKDHHKVFNSDVYFSQAHNAIVFKSDVLDKKMPQHNDILLNVMKHSLETIGEIHLNTASLNLLSKVRNELQILLPAGKANLDFIANNLNIPSWTLQRRLSEQGISFKYLLEQTRQELAVHYLENENMSISELADLLGYTEISAFSRAFQRWYGLPPKKWQANNSHRKCITEHYAQEENNNSRNH